MPVRLDISNFKCLNQLRNGADFTANTSEFASTLVGNVGEKVKVSYKATFNYSSNAEIGNSWALKAGKITRANGNFQTDDSLVAGDVFLFFADWANNDTVSEEFEATITGFSDGGKALLFSVNSGTQISTGTLTNVGLICDPNDSANAHTVMINKFGVIPNTDDYNNNSLVSDNSQSYAIAGLSGITAPITATPEGIYRDWVTGSMTAFIESVDTAGYTITYQVDHIFIISPSYIVGYLANLQNSTAPDIFAGDNSLKYSFELLLRKTKTDTATSKTVILDTLIGSVGWFDENFNGASPDYSASTVYEDTATTDTATALQTSRKTTATITILKASAPFSAGQVLTAYVQYLPLNESAYTDTATPYQDNFLYDTIRVVEGAGNVAGTGIIKRANAGLSGDDIVLELDCEYTTAQGLTITDGNYLISVSCEDSALSAGNSDRVMVLADVQSYQAIGLISGLLTFDKFDLLVHNQVLGVDTGSIFANAWNEDGLLLDFGFSLELAQLAVITQLELKLVAFKSADETYFELDKYVIDCTDFVVADESQQLEVDTTRGYNLADDDQFNFVKLTTGAKVGTVQSYTGSFGQKVTWQDWLANINADTVFYDSAEPQNNLNQKSSNYSALEGYVIKIIAEATLTGIDDLGNAGSGFETGQVEAITVNNYGVSDDGAFTALDIQTLEIDTEVNLGGQLNYNEATLFRATFTTSDASLSNIWAIHRLYEKNSQGNNLIAELSSILAYPDDNVLLPIDGQTQLYLYADSGNIVSECLIDNARIDFSKEYTLTARIDRASEVFIFSTIFNQAVSGTFTASVTNAVSGVWLLGATIIAGNSLSTTDAYLDGSLKLVKYTASAFTSLTAIDIDDTQARGTLDISNASFTSLLNVTAINNQFDTVLFGEWVQTTLVNIDLTNSVITVDVLELIIDNLIIANGGTTTDDGVNYTGVAGVTAASRVLAVGTITIDITTTGILYEKVLALIAVGWNITTINTVCLKNRVFNSDLQDFITWTVDDNFFEIASIDYIDADSLIVAYYDTITNAIAGTATGRLALGESAVNVYLSGTGWASGEALRIYNALGEPLQTATLNYKATPLSGVPCGLQSTAYIAGNAKIYDGTFDYDTVNSWAEVDKGQAWTVNIQTLIDSLASNVTYLTQGITSRLVAGYDDQKGVAISVTSAGLVSVNMAGGSGLDRLIVRFSAVGIGYNSIFVTYDGSGSALGFTARANGNNLTRTVVQNDLSSSILQSTTKTVIIGATIATGGVVSNHVDGLIRKIQWMDTDYSGTQTLLDAEAVGSFEGIVADARFLLEPDFDQTGTANLTTRSGTPTYTITATGGAAYTKFIP